MYFLLFSINLAETVIGLQAALITIPVEEVLLHLFNNAARAYDNNLVLSMSEKIQVRL